MDKSSIGSSGSCSGIFPSPGLPNYQTSSGEPYLKNWISERVPLSAYNKRRVSGSELVVFDNGRTLPSKWVDAEKWICSPVPGDGVGRQFMPRYYVRTQKSKSGPLVSVTGNSGVYSATSPIAPFFDNRRERKLLARSPFRAEAFVPEHEGCANGESQSVNVANEVDSDRDEKFVGYNEGSKTISSLPLRDRATQMNAERTTPSSLAPSTEQLESEVPKLEVRDVQVDNRVTIIRWSKKHTSRCSDLSSAKIVEWKKTVDTEDRLCELSETKSVSKYLREEARITAWENLQKAKAEAAIRKLETKLEKKRSSSMDKIINKLGLAQKKAQEMRNALNAHRANKFEITPKKNSYSYRKKGHISGCFACPAF